MQRSYLLAATAAAALVLAGCNRNNADQATTNAAATLPDLPATLPLTTGSASVIANAPQAGALPSARPINLVRTRSARDAYAYADRAYGFGDALGEAPPDYGFDYEGVEPWAWQGYDDSLEFAEPIEGGYRYYYYRPGAETPYFVRDPYYGYGYDGDALAVVYAADGGIVPFEDYGPRLDYAARYWTRGRDLWAASRRGDRRGVIAADWAARDAVIADSRARWFDSRRNQPDWAAYAAATDARRAAYWRTEDVRREADARRFERWQREDFRTPPPPRAIPPGWREARWARDPRRYAPASAAMAHPIEVARGPGLERGPGGPPRGPDRIGFERGPGVANVDRGPGGSGFERGPRDDRARAAMTRPGRPDGADFIRGLRGAEGGPGAAGPRAPDAERRGPGAVRAETRGPVATRPDVNRAPGGPARIAAGRPDRPGRDFAARAAARGNPDAEARRGGGPQVGMMRPDRGGPGAGAMRGGRPDGAAMRNQAPDMRGGAGAMRAARPDGGNSRGPAPEARGPSASAPGGGRPNAGAPRGGPQGGGMLQGGAPRGRPGGGGQGGKPGAGGPPHGRPG